MTEKQKNIHAQAMARLRVESLTPKRRSEIARNAQVFSVQTRHRNKALKTSQDARNSTNDGDAT